MAADDKYVISVEAKTDDAEKKLKAVANATEQVGNASKKTAKDAQNLSGVVGQAAEAASSMGGAFGGAGRVVAIFSASLRALKMALAGATGGISLLIGAIATAVAAVVGLFQRHKEELKAFEEQQRQTAQNTQANLQRLNQARLDGLTKSYADAEASANALLSTTERLAATHRQWVDANLQWNLSMLDKEEQEALAGAVGDSRAQEDIKARYAAQRARVSGEAALQNAQNDVSSAEAKHGAARETREAKAAQLSDTAAAREAAIAKRDRIVRRLNGLNASLAESDTPERRERIGRLEGAYKATLEEIRALDAALPKLRQELNALTAEVSVAESGVSIAKLNLETTKNKNASSRQSVANADAERNTQRARAEAEAAARAKAQQEAEQAKADARAQRIQEADALAAKEAGDVDALQAQAAQHRAALSGAQGQLQRARQAHASAVQRQGSRRTSLFAAQDAGTVAHTAAEARRAEEAFTQAAKAAEAFFKTFDAALRREQGEAERAAQRAKAARETN